MRLCQVKIHNYRSVNDLTLDCGSLLVLLGPNNHGKSNVLSAIEFGLSTSIKPQSKDFFYHRDPSDSSLWVEMSFTELTAQERTTFKRYILSDDTVCIRKTAEIGDGGVDVSFNGWLDQPDQEWLRADRAGDYASREKVKATPLSDLVPQSGRVTKADIEAAQNLYIQDHESEINFTKTLEQGPLLGSRNVGGGVLPEFYIIPAVRDLTDEIKIKATTNFGRLMSRAVQEMAERDPRFVEAREQLKTVISSLNERDGESKNELAALEKSIEEELKSWGVQVNIEVTPPELEKLFELGTELELNDGTPTPASDKGHGLQRAVIFALLRSWASTLRADKRNEESGDTSPRKQSESVIFAMEEPELFLHPHAQRKLSGSLREIAGSPEHQVVLCTHSTYFVDLANYKEIAIITKEDAKEGSQVRQHRDELFSGEGLDDRKKRFRMAHWINPDRGEMFFAKRVVFVEGETEKVAIPFVGQMMSLVDPDVSIVDCGSKFNLPLYVEIAKAFGVRYIVVHDEDPIPDGLEGDKLAKKQRTFAVNAELKTAVESPLGDIEIFAPDFEQACGIPKAQGEKKGKSLAALEYLEDKQENDIAERLRSVVKAVYS